MRFLAAFMIAVLFLLPFAGTGNAMVPAVKKSCCAKMERMRHCKDASSNKQKDDCQNGNCNMIMGCNQCGFLAVEKIMLTPRTFSYIDQPTTPYKIGDPSEFHPSGWQPPEF